MVFEKFEAWSFQAPQAGALFSAAWNFWANRGYAVHSTGPTSLQGRSYQSKLGIHRVVDLTILPAGDGASAQLRFRADVRADVAAGGALVAVFLLPVAVVGAAISWHEYEMDWSRERWDFWNFLVGNAGAKPVPSLSPPGPPSSPITGPVSSTPPEGAPAPPPPPPVPAGASPTRGPGSASGTCSRCGAAVVGEGKFCASCGAPLHAP